MRIRHGYGYAETCADADKARIRIRRGYGYAMDTDVLSVTTFNEHLGVGHYLCVEIAWCKRKYLNKALIDGSDPAASPPRVIIQIRRRTAWVQDKRWTKSGGRKKHDF